MNFLVDLGRNRPARIQALLEIAKATAYGHQADVLETLARVAKGAEAPCTVCGDSSLLEDLVPYEEEPVDGAESIGLACVPCVRRELAEITTDERECPECSARAHRRWCYAHERRIPTIPSAVADRVDATLGDLREVAGGKR